MKTTSGFCPCWDWRGGQPALTGQRSRRGSAAEGPGAPCCWQRTSQHTAGGVRFAAEEAGVDVLTAACTMDEISGS
ncbi:MAG: hypothetical protein ACLS8R_07645 [Anaeromassilibacillus sp.]